MTDPDNPFPTGPNYTLWIILILIPIIITILILLFVGPRAAILCLFFIFSFFVGFYLFFYIIFESLPWGIFYLLIFMAIMFFFSRSLDRQTGFENSLHRSI